AAERTPARDSRYGTRRGRATVCQRRRLPADLGGPGATLVLGFGRAQDDGLGAVTRSQPAGRQLDVGAVAAAVAHFHYRAEARRRPRAALHDGGELCHELRGRFFFGGLRPWPHQLFELEGDARAYSGG